MSVDNLTASILERYVRQRRRSAGVLSVEGKLTDVGIAPNVSQPYVFEDERLISKCPSDLPTEQPIRERINSIGRSHSSRFSSFESDGFTSRDCRLLFLVGTKFRNRSNMIRQLLWNGNHVGIYIFHIHDLINIFTEKEHVDRWWSSVLSKNTNTVEDQRVCFRSISDHVICYWRRDERAFGLK